MWLKGVVQRILGQAQAIRIDELYCRQVYFLNFQGTPSREEHKLKLRSSSCQVYKIHKIPKLQKFQFTKFLKNKIPKLWNFKVTKFPI